MCIHFHPRLNEISEEEIEVADQAAVDHEDEEEEEEYVSDAESLSAPDYEVKGLRGLNHFMKLWGEDEVLEEHWRELCVIQKLEVFDILLDLDLETELEHIELEYVSKKGKDAVSRIRAIVEGGSEKAEENAVFPCQDDL